MSISARNMSIRKIIALSTSIVLSCANTVNANSTNSRPIARLLTDGDRTKPKGSLIFSGDHLNPKDGKSLQILCYLNYQILDIAKDNLESKCDEASRPSINNCKINRTCPKVKKTSQSLAIPKITQPYSSIIINPKPTFYWNQVPQAANYTVILEGHEVNWKKTTKNTTLAYPIEEKSLKPGNVYKLTIINNNQENFPVNSSSRVLIMLPNDKIRIIESTIKQVKDLNLHPDKEARDIETVYMSKHLLTQSIQVLRERIDIGSLDPTLHRLLGDRYLQAGLTEKAKLSYTTATKLAQEANHSKEFQLAQNGLALINDLTK